MIFVGNQNSFGGFGGGGSYQNGGGGGYTGGIGSVDRKISGGGGGSFCSDPDGRRTLGWWENGKCTIKYTGP